MVFCLAGCTHAGRFLDQLSVVQAHRHRAVGARSTQQGVNSHSHLFHHVELGTVRPPWCPDSLSIQKHNADIKRSFCSVPSKCHGEKNSEEKRAL